MSNRMTGLFLGAGASFEAGLPLVWDLTSEIRANLSAAKFRTFNSHWLSMGGGYPEDVVDAFVGALEHKEMHYESILGFLQTQNRRISSRQSKYSELYAWFVDYVWHVLYLRHRDRKDYIIEGLRFLDGIIGMTQTDKPLWIFSLNHDLVIEALAAHYNTPISCGFTGTDSLPLRDEHRNLIQETLPIETLAKADLESGRLNFLSHGSRGINLLKIHGALDVFTYNDGNDLLRIATSKSASAVIDGLNQIVLGLKLSTAGPRAINEIVYSDSQGEIKFLRRSLVAGAFKFDGRTQQTLPDIYLSLFQTRINYISDLICLGYGFGDDHINRVIRSWLESTGDRRLTIVSPNAKNVPSTLIHLTSQVTVVALSTVAYLEPFSPKALELSERDVLHIRELAREDVRKIKGFA